MTKQELVSDINNSLTEIGQLFVDKNQEYGKDEDAFSIFNKIGKRLDCSPHHILTILRGKHEVSIQEISDSILSKTKIWNSEKINEKYNDIIIYYLLEKAMMQYQNQLNRI